MVLYLLVTAIRTDVVTLTLLSANPATGSVTPEGETVHRRGSQVTIAAIGIAPFGFSNWDDEQGDESYQSVRIITMDSDKTITAYFGYVGE